MKDEYKLRGGIREDRKIEIKEKKRNKEKERREKRNERMCSDIRSLEFDWELSFSHSKNFINHGNTVRITYIKGNYHLKESFTLVTYSRAQSKERMATR